jgi:hypothetical protein
VSIGKHTHDGSAVEESCSLCWNFDKKLTSASHKVIEETPLYDHYNFEVPVRRHGYSNYLCCSCFGLIMGVVAAKWCADG